MVHFIGDFSVIKTPNFDIGGAQGLYFVAGMLARMSGLGALPWFTLHLGFDTYEIMRKHDPVTQKTLIQTAVNVGFATAGHMNAGNLGPLPLLPNPGFL